MSYRTQDKKEIDFILDEIPYEVKIAYNGKRLNALEFFYEKYGKKGSVITLEKNKSDKYLQYYLREL